jgi:hypothetical protein
VFLWAGILVEGQSTINQGSVIRFAAKASFFFFFFQNMLTTTGQPPIQYVPGAVFLSINRESDWGMKLNTSQYPVPSCRVELVMSTVTHAYLACQG